MESEIYKRLKTNCKSTRIIRVENRIEIATPDMYYTNKESNGWIEAKEMDIMHSTVIPWHNGYAQYEWLRKNFLYGGLSILCIIDNGKLRKNGLFFVVNGYIAETLQCACYVRNKDLENFLRSPISEEWIPSPIEEFRKEYSFIWN